MDIPFYFPLAFCRSAKLYQPSPLSHRPQQTTRKLQTRLPETRIEPKESVLPTVEDPDEDTKGGTQGTPPPLPRRRFQAPSEGAVLMPSVTVRGKGGFAMGGGVVKSPPPLPSRVG